MREAAREDAYLAVLVVVVTAFVLSVAYRNVEAGNLVLAGALLVGVAGYVTGTVGDFLSGGSTVSTAMMLAGVTLTGLGVAHHFHLTGRTALAAVLAAWTALPAVVLTIWLYATLRQHHDPDWLLIGDDQ